MRNLVVPRNTVFHCGPPRASSAILEPSQAQYKDKKERKLFDRASAAPSRD